MALLQRIKTMFDEQDVVDEPTDLSSGLYQCSMCDTTYIATSMDDCPNCNSTVTEVPSEL